MPILYTSRISPKAKGKAREPYSKSARQIALEKAAAGQGDLVMSRTDTKKGVRTTDTYTKSHLGPVRRVKSKTKLAKGSY